MPRRRTIVVDRSADQGGRSFLSDIGVLERRLEHLSDRLSKSDSQSARGFVKREIQALGGEYGAIDCMYRMRPEVESGINATDLVRIALRHMEAAGDERWLSDARKLLRETPA